MALPSLLFSPARRFAPQFRPSTCNTRLLFRCCTNIPDPKEKTRSLIKYVPSSIVPYWKLARVDKPIGSWLLFIPGAWSIALAAPAGGLPDARLLALFGVGALCMRGAGCTINDMWDVEFDKKVERTKTRPIASGQVSYGQATAFLALQLSGALAVLLSLNFYCFPLGALALLPVAMYPLAKRFTDWPQAVLGLTFNWGSIMGWAAVHGSLDLGVVVPLYIACINWTLAYDTIYAHQDKKDDINVGVRSTALLFGDRTRGVLTSFALSMAGLLSLAGYNAALTAPYYAAVALAYVHLQHQISTVDLDKPADCGAKFMSNQQIGLILFIGIVLGTLLKKPTTAESDCLQRAQSTIPTE
eukprot:scpid64247/ scgid12147/ 4-hydroxybenzoate polyprenyltransferase, mitochondrial; COQ2 homolog; Para-hydroxybenzoate--polyprenyltransferase